MSWAPNSDQRICRFLHMRDRMVWNRRDCALESIQDGEKGQAAEAAVSSLETAIEALEEIENQVDEATSALEDSSQARQGAWL